MRALGLNIVGLSDFHGDLHANDTGPGRFEDQRDYCEAPQKASDKDFLVTPWEEPSAFFGGHYNIDVPEERVLDQAPRRRAAVHGERCQASARSITPAAPTTCSRCWTPRAATGSTRTRERKARPATPT